MKRSLFFVMAALLLWADFAFTQFVVISSVPVDGDVSVPLSTTVSFTFSAALDTNLHFGERQLAVALIAADPRDSLSFGTISYSPDLRTISAQVTHTANTDFVWLINDARSQTGEPLAQPYALSYTTSAAHGVQTVSGVATYPGGNPANAAVGLLDRPLFTEEENIILAGAIVPNSSGDYVVNYVRDGVYWPVAVKDLNGDGQVDPSVDAIGFYDPNNDAQQDSIVVAGSNLSGIDMAMRLLFVPVTAKFYLETAAARAQQFAPDQELRAIIAHADTIGLDGTSVFWLYYFYSPSLQFPTRVLVSSFFTQTDTSRLGEPNLPPNMRAIPANFIDSDVAMAVAETNGGSDFRAQHNVVRRFISGGNLFWIFPQDTTKIFWVVGYDAIAPDSSTLTFRALVDMVTGELITDVDEPKAPIPQAFSLSQNYPNPFNPATTIEFSLPQASAVSLKIYNVRGEEVATLVSEKLPPGNYKRVWSAAGVSSGVFFYRLQAGTFVETRKLLLLR